MSFREKSAWITACALLVIYGTYFGTLWSNWDARTAWPMSIGLMVAAVIGLTIIMAATHIALAIERPKEAAASADEREKLIGLKAEAIASYVLSAAVFCLIAALLLGWSGVFVANLLLAAMVVSELVKAGAQIVYFRQDA